VIYGDIITRVIVEVFGSDVPQPEVLTNLYGVDGIIDNIRKKLQEDYDYWFMLETTTETLVDSQSAYDIDYEFKKEIDLRIEDENGSFYDPLTKISPKESDTLQSSSSDPLYYWTDYSTYRRFNLYPTPSITAPATRTLHIRYWKYLARLSADNDTLDAAEDVISIECPYYIINKAASLISKTIENYEKMSLFETYAQSELQDLKKKDFKYKTANLLIPYRRI
jgi:hypothetical protein